MFKWFRSKHSNAYADEHIMVNKSAFELHKKEEEIYYKTIKFEKDYSIFIDFDYLFYDFQIYCEFIEKNKKNFNLEYDWNFYDLLDNFSLVLRFLKIWHYNLCWIYLRKAFEERIYMISCGKCGRNVKNNLEYILKQRISDSWPLIFDKDEVYKMYTYLSEKYTHNHINVLDIEFNDEKYLEIEWISVMTIIIIANITTQLVDIDEVERRWLDIIDYPIEEHIQYCSYIWPLIASAWFSWCHIWLENMVHYTDIQNFDFWKLWKWLDLSKWIYNYKDLDTFNIKLPTDESRN